jgi:antitoxin component HigA of HigAB toxin-antitoxin module
MQAKQLKDQNGKWMVQTPYKLFDYLREMYNLKTDAELAHILGARTPMISRVRNGAMRITPALILAIHEQTNIPVAKIRELAK